MHEIMFANKNLVKTLTSYSEFVHKNDINDPEFEPNVPRILFLENYYSDAPTFVKFTPVKNKFYWMSWNTPYL